MTRFASIRLRVAQRTITASTLNGLLESAVSRSQPVDRLEPSPLGERCSVDSSGSRVGSQRVRDNFGDRRDSGTPNKVTLFTSGGFSLSHPSGLAMLGRP